MSRATLEQWHAALAEALHDGEVRAVPGILVAMTLDGFGHEAETARRMMLAATEDVAPTAAEVRASRDGGLLPAHVVDALADEVEGYERRRGA